MTSVESNPARPLTATNYDHPVMNNMAGTKSSSLHREGDFEVRVTCVGHEKGISSIEFANCGDILASACKS